MKKPVFLQKLIVGSLSIVLGAMTLTACEKCPEPIKPAVSKPVYPESHVIDLSSYLDFSSNLEKTVDLDLPNGQIGNMEFYLVRHFAGERKTYRIPGTGADGKSFYNFSLDESSGTNRIKVIIERLSGPGESYHGISAIVSVRPGQPIVEN